MTETRIQDLPGAMSRRDHPTVGVWNRLEGRPRTTDFGRALRVEVRDPLWMLARQWQLGEFRGTDGGSPVTATYSVTASPPGRFRSDTGPDGAPGPAGPLPPDRPLEAVAERRPLPFAFGTEPISFDLRLALGRRWLKLLARSSELRSRRFGERYVELYPIALPDPANPADSARVAHPEVWAATQAVAGRRLDGYLLYLHLKGGGHAADGIDARRQRDELNALGPRLTGWFDDLIDQPSGADPQRPEGNSTWDPRRLEHRFSVSAAVPTGGERVLTAPEYPGGELDWHAFSVTPDATLGGTAPAPAPINRTVFPAPVRFSGMPLPRWWAVEDGRTNFAAVTPDSTDLARLIFLEFALVYSNDWYQLPCDLPAGTFASIQGLAVTDVFGQRRWITPPTAAATGRTASIGRCTPSTPSTPSVRPVTNWPTTPVCCCRPVRRRSRPDRRWRTSRWYVTRARTWSGESSRQCGRRPARAEAVTRPRPRRWPSAVDCIPRPPRTTPARPSPTR